MRPSLPAGVFRVLNPLTRPTLSSLRNPSSARVLLSTTPSLASGDSHYDAPTGNLFNVPPGETYKKEGWETVWVWGFFGSLGLAAAAYVFKPNTAIQTWALEEARRRLEVEGILADDEAAPSSRRA
ncbi:MAG: hypothetical protein M1832_004885 [Thelocarpon impressellum]|nr:MAG: hypothetical protein M1832_004885 [Thelocarpon impressellum]